MMKTIAQIFLTGIILAVVGVIAYFTLTSKHEEQALRIKALNDTITFYKTSDGKNAAYISVLEGSKKEVLQALGQKNKRISELIKKTQGLRTYTNHGVETRIDTVVKLDTLVLPSLDKKLYLSKHIENDYYKADVTVRADTLELGIISYNEFDYMLRDKPPSGVFKLFKPTTYVVEAINLNPNTVTKNLRTIQITPKTRNGLKIGIGIGIGVAAVLLLK